MTSLVGQSLDRYRIAALLGEGGMGAVYKAHDTMLLRDVAVKVMHAQFGRQAAFRDRFLQEGRAAARLDHPGIVKVYDFGQREDVLYIVMEFIPGANLRKLLSNLRAAGQGLKLDEGVGVIRHVALALHYAHGQGVLHRDIKPDNIMLKTEAAEGLPYRPVITDLGLAKLSEGGVATQTGTSMGTPAYMAPEQIMGSETDARSDVYSLGILLFELAVGQLPFPVKTITDAVRYHLQETPPSPRSLRPALPESLEAVILRALQKEPAERYPDARALAEALAAEQPHAATVVSGPVSSLEPAVSLVTQYQQSLVDVRGDSIIDWFPATPGTLTHDRVQVLGRDGSVQTAALKRGGMTIGRATENDLALASPKVSSRHARVEFDGAHYRVTDLNSTNGTYLGGVKLLPGVPEVWPPDKPLKIGEYYLRLESAAGPRTPPKTERTSVNASRVHTSAGGRVGLFAERAQVSLEPGKPFTLRLTLLNQGAVVDHFKTSVEGVPPDWVSIPGPVQLMPGAQAEIPLTIQPPRASSSRAGRHQLRVRAVSQDEPGQVAEVPLTLTVGAFTQVAAELRPQKLQMDRPAQVTVTNQGNAPAVITVVPQDPGDELAFRPAQAQVKVQAGATGVAQFYLGPRRTRWIGPEQLHPYSVQIAGAGAPPTTLNGQLVSRGLIPVWAPPLALVLCLALAASAALYYFGVVVPDQQAAATATQAEQTRLAVVQPGGVTPAVLSPTADDDGDGLTNGQEVILGTEPDNPDTDGGGLTDGDEVTRGLDPLAPADDGSVPVTGASETPALAASPEAGGAAPTEAPAVTSPDSPAVVASPAPAVTTPPAATPELAATTAAPVVVTTAAPIITTPPPPATETPTATPTSTPTPSPTPTNPAAPVTISFDNLKTDTYLRGSEYADRGLQISAKPRKTCLGGVEPHIQTLDPKITKLQSVLTTASATSKIECNDGVLVFKFSQSVQAVTLRFAATTGDYALAVYDSSGRLLETVPSRVRDSTAPVEYSLASRAAAVARAEFGPTTGAALPLCGIGQPCPTVVTAVVELTYSP